MLFDVVEMADSEVAREPSGTGLLCRAGIPLLLDKTGLLAIELGVNEGHFSYRLLDGSDKIQHLYSVDAWNDSKHGHDHQQYWVALERLEPVRNRNTVLRATFDEALDFFEDGFFDLVYVDGYAHGPGWRIDAGQVVEESRAGGCALWTRLRHVAVAIDVPQRQRVCQRAGTHRGVHDGRVEVSDAHSSWVLWKPAR
mmetsp:Transcript_40944/g.82006  ORF Transcript_40944/g.82006 Transcript_40944/m.82006 type:complete len:197 (-) Transcript_40944:113-703(-)